MSDFTYRSQDVDYLGFIEAQLRDLQGIDRLAYELIQNADDVQPSGDASSHTTAPTRLVFDVTDEALVVENDAVFRPVDFQRLQRLAGGAKRDEADTTGAFGLGFIAVYQVTDAPEIFSNDLHWIIHPEAPPERRIEERRLPTTGTRFVLPWAFDPSSPVRRALRIETVTQQQLDDLARQLAAATRLAILFLKQLTRLEVRRNGRLLQSLQRDLQGNRLTVTRADGQSIDWLHLNGNFESEARALRQAYPWQIEEKRHANVQLAVPTDAAGAHLPDQGRLFAVLPTEATMPLALHVNADFFPTTDRRRIHFDGGFQARWNEEALNCAARLLANNLTTLRDALPVDGFWQLLQSAWDTAESAGSKQLPPPFASFWRELAPLLGAAPVVFTADERWVVPSAARIVERSESHHALEQLGIAPVHHHLAPYFHLMRRPQIGVPPLSPGDLGEALRAGTLQPGQLLALTPAPFDTIQGWHPIWQLIDDWLATQPPHTRRELAETALRNAPLAIDENMSLATLNRLYRGDEETRAIFPGVAWLHPLLTGDPFPAYLVPQFGVRQAVEWLAQQTQQELQQAWQMGHLDLPRLFRWFESHQIEIFGDDPALQREIATLPLVPVDGELRPLSHLYIPGGFEDPLKLAAIVDIDALGGRRQFLQDLGLQQLDFDTYVHTHLPRVLAPNPDLPSDARHRLLQLLAQRLGQMRDDTDLRHTLGQLPLIPAMDGAFRPARSLYATRDIAALLGLHVHVAEPPPTEAIAALYRWLGVRQKPSAEDLIAAISLIATQYTATRKPLDEESLARLRQSWQHLDALHSQERLAPEQLAQLAAARSLPNRNLTPCHPAHLYLVDQPETLVPFDLAGKALDKYLLHPSLPPTPLLFAAGVRPLHEALYQDIVGEQPPSPAPHIEQRLQERLPLMTRLLHDAPSQSAAHDHLQSLRRLRIFQLPHLQTQMRLDLGHDTFTTAPQPQLAVYIARSNALYVDAAEQTTLWSAIARELAAIITPPTPSPGLALGIRELLTAASNEQAAAILDELGYP